ncbi:MAG TPA: long-chain fatty acid--CoA ligase [Gaiellaceae bacterium]|jgi:long-chain acyl-CoA synthetase
MTAASAPSLEPAHLGRGRTLPELWRAALDEGRSTPAYLEERGQTWEPVTWEEASRRIDELANGLLARGIRKGDAVAILSRTRLEWALLDWAITSIGAVTVGLYPTSSASECAYILAHSEAILLLAEDDEQLAKIAGVRDEAPQVREVVSFDELDALSEAGRAHAREHPTALETARGKVGEDDLATLIYTSGTTGPPKGCMLTHRNCVAAATRVDRAITQAGDVLLLFLPLAHSFGRLVLESGAFHGFAIAFCTEATAVPRALEVVRPTVLPAVPRLYEKIHTGVLSQLDETHGLKRRIGDWALRVGARSAKLRREGRPVPAALRIQAELADRLVFAKIRKRLGGRMRVAISGAAPLAPEVLEFFDVIGLTVVEGYGLSETMGSCSVNHPDDRRIGTVGRVLLGSEVRIEPDGEVLIRSDSVFAGYYKDDQGTREALTDDGWLRTGDVGDLDEDGFLRITDRKKDLIITAGGKNIAPQNLENALKTSRFVSHAVVVGDRRPYVSALVTVDADEVAKSGRTADELVQEAVDGVNRDLARAEQIKRFVVLPRDFTQEDGELTATLKLKRRVVNEHFAAEIEQLYS